MNASVGPLFLVGLTYLIAVIISFGVAVIISIIVGIINRKSNSAAADSSPK